MLADGKRLDLAAAWRASRARYLVLAAVVIGATVLERALGSAGAGLASPPELVSWSALLSPERLAVLAWRSVTGVAALVLMAGAVATVWRNAKQTLD